jgi:hypothetical protein
MIGKANNKCHSKLKAGPENAGPVDCMNFAGDPGNDKLKHDWKKLTEFRYGHFPSAATADVLIRPAYGDSGYIHGHAFIAR